MISSLIDAEQVMSESDSCTSHDSTACTCRLIGPDTQPGVPAGLGGVDRGNQWHVEVFGQRDRGMGDQPVVGVHDVGPPRRRRRRLALIASPARTIEWPIASVHAIMSVPKSNSCGSCAAATTRTPSAISSVDGWVLGSVPPGAG